MTLTRENPAGREWRKRIRVPKLCVIYAKLMFCTQEYQFEQ